MIRDTVSKRLELKACFFFPAKKKQKVLLSTYFLCGYVDYSIILHLGLGNAR